SLSFMVYILYYYLFVVLFIFPRTHRRTLFPTRRSSDLTKPRVFSRPILGCLYQERPTKKSDRFDRRCRGRDRWPRHRRSNRSLLDRKSTRLNSSHEWISYAVFCLKKKITNKPNEQCTSD